MELAPLLRRFGDFLTGLGTQPITIDIPVLAGEMLHTWASSRDARANFAAFSWLQSGDIYSILDEYILTREFLHFAEGRMPFAEVTFYPSTYQPAGSLTLQLDFGWAPPTIGFEELRNVFAESDVFVLKPTLDRSLQSLSPLHVEYKTELGAQLPWDDEKGQFEGRCPPEIAGSVGAGRLEAFTVPLNMSAVVTMAFPGGVHLERAIRLVIPVTIKRRPDTCQGASVLCSSPEVRRPAFSQILRDRPVDDLASLERVDSVTETKETGAAPATSTPVRCYNVRRDSVLEQQEDVSDLSDLTPRELTMLLRRKAKLGAPGSPLRFDPLSMARLYEAAQPQHSSPPDIECWTIHVDSPLALSDHSRISPGKAGGASLSPMIFGGLRVSPRACTMAGRNRSGKISQKKGKVPKTTDAEVLSEADLQVLRERLTKSSPASHPPSTDREQEAVPVDEKVDSPMQDITIDGTKPCFSTPHASPTPSCRAPLRDWKALRDRRAMPNSSKSSEWRIENWRRAPEKLNDAEKDVLQKTIQESYEKMQKEKENRENVEESEIEGADSEVDMSFEN